MAQKTRDPKERLFAIARFIDALEQDFLSAYPDQPPLFKDSMEQELKRLFTLMSL
jgi:hypothetical protein